MQGEMLLYAETKEIGSDIYTEMYASSKLDSEAKVKTCS